MQACRNVASARIVKRDAIISAIANKHAKRCLVCVRPPGDTMRRSGLKPLALIRSRTHNSVGARVVRELCRRYKIALNISHGGIEGMELRLPYGLGATPKREWPELLHSDELKGVGLPEVASCGEGVGME